MTRDHQQHQNVTRAARRLVGAAAVAVVGVIGLSSFGDSADAARRTKSEAIADAAGLAVDALARWEQTSNPVDYVRFVQHRDHAAAMTEADIEVPAGVLHDAWSSVPISKQQAVLSAVSQLGVPYRSIASEPGVGFDCSGLTTWAFGEAGVDLPRISRDQINDAESIERDDAVAGDLVYYPGHISIYLGAELMVHSPNSGSHVEVTWLPSRSLRFGDATPMAVVPDDAEPADDAAGTGDVGSGVADPAASLVDRTLAVSK